MLFAAFTLGYVVGSVSQPPRATLSRPPASSTPPSRDMEQHVTGLQSTLPDK
jgi:hypothetical protein